MTDNEREAIRLLGVYTAERYDPWILMGPAKAGCRAHIMSALAGKRIPQAKSGVNAIKDAIGAIPEVASHPGPVDALGNDERYASKVKAVAFAAKLIGAA